MKVRRLNRKITGFAVLLSATSLFAGGSVTGTVKFIGKAPQMKAINRQMAADPLCAAQHQDAPVRTEWLVAGENGELKNVYVYVKEGLEGQEFSSPESAATIDQNGCIYIPHVLGIQVGQPIEILNSDGTLHNVHALPKVKGNDAFNVAMPGMRKKITKKFDVPEVMIKIKCDVHPWMGAYVGVLDHPYFSVTDDSGTYTIEGLPPGNYTLEAWHERLKTLTVTVTIKGDEAVEANFNFKRPEKKKDE
ncbi:MAG: carboxypeptidase regulatory-like domain-containing protein [Candidatus Marinimicrobia bacterium]|nr:carboxypeptidase regulatory-like domain-containing protein [Candidatus Neomarinimicrobiota bacterium]